MTRCMELMHLKSESIGFLATEFLLGSFWNLWQISEFKTKDGIIFTLHSRLVFRVEFQKIFLKLFMPDVI